MAAMPMPARAASITASVSGNCSLYFSPLACSMATRICLYEFGIDAQYVQVDTKTKLTQDGADFRAINPLGREARSRCMGQRVCPGTTATIPVLHRHRAAQGPVCSVVGFKGARQREILCARQGAITPELGSRQASPDAT